MTDSELDRLKGIASEAFWSYRNELGWGPPSGATLRLNRNGSSYLEIGWRVMLSTGEVGSAMPSLDLSEPPEKFEQTVRDCAELMAMNSVSMAMREVIKPRKRTERSNDLLDVVTPWKNAYYSR